MKSAITPIVKDLVLVGGGHSHAIALKLLGMNPIPGLRLTLMTNVYHTPYSGMLPGYVAGLYTYDECHIDLRPLSQFAQARLIVDQAIGLDLDHNRILCANHPPVSFDVLSLDIGSTPATVTVPGAKDHAIPVKPISQFLTYWETLKQDIEAASMAASSTPLRLGIVGGGAGGVELALSMQAGLSRLPSDRPDPQIHLFHRGPEVLPERHPRMRRLFQEMITERGIQLHLNEAVVALEADGDSDSVASEQSPWGSAVAVQRQSGQVVECDRVFWVTSASAASWVAASGLATDDRGFIQVNDYLQSVSHPHVFAAGDIATMVDHPRPKAGVFAVRQGQPLYDNLCRAVRGERLQPFQPQREFLILVGTGYEEAIASRGWLSFGPSPLLWRWKDRIDRVFMERFTHLSPMTMDPAANSGQANSGQANSSHPSPLLAAPEQANVLNGKGLHAAPMPCAGCASKVGKSVLTRVLSQIQPQSSTAVIGLDRADDAAVIQPPAGRSLVQTVDYFRAILDDPYLVGQITTQHCLNDIYAMGADPHSALAIATLPYAVPNKLEETLYFLLSGVVDALEEVGAELIGGHTVEGAELGLGLSCNGFAAPDGLWRKGGLQPGNVLILTKALGTGTLFAADMQLKAKGRWIDGAIASMVQSHRAAVGCLREYNATACTDVTGYGLLGHLSEMVEASRVNVTLNLAALPVLPGASETLAMGIVSSLHGQNHQAGQELLVPSALTHHAHYPLLFDPQTSGGLLAAVPPGRVKPCIETLQTLGYSHSRVIGRVTALPEEAVSGDRFPAISLDTTAFAA